MVVECHQIKRKGMMRMECHQIKGKGMVMMESQKKKGKSKRKSLVFLLVYSLSRAELLQKNHQIGRKNRKRPVRETLDDRDAQPLLDGRPEARHRFLGRLLRQRL